MIQEITLRETKEYRVIVECDPGNIDAAIAAAWRCSDDWDIDDHDIVSKSSELAGKAYADYTYNKETKELDC